jgi:hypothetical protein
MEPFEPECKGGTLRGGSASVSEQRAGDRLRIDNRETPVVQLDALGKELCAQTVAIAGDRVKAQRRAHAG